MTFIQYKSIKQKTFYLYDKKSPKLAYSVGIMHPGSIDFGPTSLINYQSGESFYGDEMAYECMSEEFHLFKEIEVEIFLDKNKKKQIKRKNYKKRSFNYDLFCRYPNESMPYNTIQGDIARTVKYFHNIPYGYDYVIIIKQPNFGDLLLRSDAISHINNQLLDWLKNNVDPLDYHICKHVIDNEPKLLFQRYWAIGLKHKNDAILAMMLFPEAIFKHNLSL